MIERQKEELKKIIDLASPDENTVVEYLQRLNEGCLTKDENKESHFCVYFAACDTSAKEVFMGLHKKSGLWLFNGGHLKIGETPFDTLRREETEEWGIPMDLSTLARLSFLSITDIVNQATKHPCKKHYDIWYFIHVEKSMFIPDKNKLGEEFYRTEWLSISQARELVNDPANLKALSLFEEMFLGNS